MNTQDLVPILDEIQARKQELVTLNQELEQAAKAYEAIEQKTRNQSLEIRSLYSVLQYCIDYDMDPTQAKLSMRSEHYESGNSASPRGSRLTTLPSAMGVNLMSNCTTAAVPSLSSTKSFWGKMFSSLKN